MAVGQRLLFSVKQPLYGPLVAAFFLKEAIQIGEESCFLYENTKISSANGILRALGTIHSDKKLYGENHLDSSQIDYWLDFSSSLNASDFKKLSSQFDILDNHLTLSSFMVGYHLTLADLAIWGALKGNAIFNKQLKGGIVSKYLARWYNHVSSLDFVTQALATLNSKDSSKEKSDQPNMDIGLVDAKEGQVVTRFPPEPSGYLHIGHAKAAMLNEYFARTYKGKLICRFDDTNPSKEKLEFENSIKEDLKLLGIVPDVTTHTSSYFDKIYQYAIDIIKMGKAYCDDTDQETMRKERFDGIESKNRDMSVEKTLEIFEEMKKGTEKGLKYCLRAKMLMKDNNKALRDPVIYRCNLIPHHATGTQWKIYPTYDFACPIVDSLEGVTHALRTTEYHDRNAQYKWFLETLNLRKVHIWGFSRLNFIYTVMSKRKLTWFVESGLVSGWDDPRFPTVRGIRRRGMTIEALRQFILSQGASQRELALEWDKFWTFNKKVIDPIAPRHVAIEKKNIVKVQVLDSMKSEVKQMPKHKKNPDVGFKNTLYHNEFFLEQQDAITLEEGEEITLMDWGNVIVEKINKKETVESIQVKLNLEGDFKKTKKKLTWLASNSSQEAVDLTLVDYDYLVTKPKLEPDDPFEDFVNPVTEFRTLAIGDANLKSCKVGDIIQLERKGYYICDQVSPELCFILIPDGKASSLALKSAVNSSPAEKPKGKEKQAKRESKSQINMYTVDSIYDDSNPPSTVGKMYEVESVYKGMVLENQKAGSKEQKQPSKQKKEKTDKKPAPPSTINSEASIISKLDICVGKVISVKKHPDADSLYVEEIDVGEAEPRTVVSGLVKFMKPEDIMGKTILVLKNLKPVAMRGIKSHAMVLCASNQDHTVVEFLQPPVGSLPGDKVFFKGHEGEPEPLLNPKKKVWETVQPDFTTTEDLVAVWKGVAFETSKGIVKAATLKNASIK